MLELRILPSSLENTAGAKTVASPAVKTADSLLQEVRMRHGNIILEGPPTFLWGQDYQDPAFVGAWHLVNVFLRRFPLDKTSLFVLFDDVANRPETVTTKLVQERMLILKNSSVPLKSSPVFRYSNYQGLTSLEFSQSQFQDKGQECFVADAQFQAQKFNYIQTRGGSYDDMRTTSIIVIHPKERFEKEQLQMLNYLQSNTMRNKGYLHKESHRLIQQSYRHVWVNQAGEISGVTQPIWDGNKFTGFKQISVK